jgi:hypothetical protein
VGAPQIAGDGLRSRATLVTALAAGDVDRHLSLFVLAEVEGESVNHLDVGLPVHDLGESLGTALGFA